MWTQKTFQVVAVLQGMELTVFAFKLWSTSLTCHIAHIYQHGLIEIGVHFQGGRWIVLWYIVEDEWWEDVRVRLSPGGCSKPKFWLLRSSWYWASYTCSCWFTQNPWMFAVADERVFGSSSNPAKNRREVIEHYARWVLSCCSLHIELTFIGAWYLPYLRGNAGTCLDDILWLHPLSS